MITMRSLIRKWFVKTRTGQSLEIIRVNIEDVLTDLSEAGVKPRSYYECYGNIPSKQHLIDKLYTYYKIISRILGRQAKTLDKEDS